MEPTQREPAGRFPNEPVERSPDPSDDLSPDTSESDELAQIRAATPAVPQRKEWWALSFSWLLLAGALLLVANGRDALPVAAWLAPLFLLRFFRRQRIWIGVPAGFLVVAPACAFAWSNVIPFRGAPLIAVAAAIGVVTLLPFTIDRLLAHRLRGWGSSLVFPFSVVAVEFVTASVSPYGTWGHPAYTQAGDPTLMQLVSVTGIWGVSFLMAWFASAVNGLWERGPRDRGARVAAIACGLLLAAVHLGGGARLGRESGGEAIRVASFAMSSTPPVAIDALRAERFEKSALDSLRGRITGLQQSLFARARQEAKAGARIVFWSEANAVVLTPDVEDFLVEGATLAHDEGIHLGMSFATLMPGEGTYENRFVVLNPEGEILLDYHKARPVPGARERGSDRHLAVAETPFGRVAAAIGFDADFPALVREAGEARADLLLVPASDQRSIDPLHARMAVVRGIENGCAIVRPALQGRSLATDSRGRVLASVGFFDGEPCVMVAQIPRRGEATIYARVGDLLAWLCLVGLATQVGLALRAARPARRPQERPAPLAEAA